MTDEEKYAITRLAVHAIDYDGRHRKKWYKVKDEYVDFDSTRDAQIALIYIMKQNGGDM